MFKMKILIILQHNRLTGVNSWAYTLTNELIKLGFFVDIQIKNLETYLSIFENNIKKIASNIYIAKIAPYKKYDVIICNYDWDLHDVAFVKAVKIFVSHGCMFHAYRPSLPVSAHIGISETVVEIYHCDYLIRNGIDLIRFKSYYPDNNFPKNVAFLSRNEPDSNLIKACKYLDIKCKHIKDKWDVENQIMDCDFVIGYGRSCYEGMASGKPVFIYGHNGADGWVKKENFEYFLKRNCSGWSKHINLADYKDVADQISQYNSCDGNTNRKLSEKYLDSKKMAEKYKEIFEKIL